MIWVISGTQDGRELVARLAKEKDIPIVATVVSNYGKQLLEDAGTDVVVGRLTQNDMEDMIRERGIRLVIDASHPYAAIVSETARAACKSVGVKYVRYERPEAPLPEYDRLFIVHNEEEAAAKAGELGDKIYLTTGSKTMHIFAHSPSLTNKEVWSRVLPTAEVISMMQELGMRPKYIIGMQGPFTYEMNRVMFHDTNAEVVVMKNSGLVGGTDTKLQAAMDEGLNIVVIDRPKNKDTDFILVDCIDSIFEIMEEL